MKIFKAFILSLFMVLPCLSSDDQSDAATHPFSTRPDLSWSAFEHAFREQYKGLDIPRIDVTTDLKISPAAYHNGYQIIGVNPQFVKDSKMSPEALRFMLLHENGHHNFDIEKRKANHELARSVFNIQPQGSIHTDIALSALQKALMATNAYKIFRRGPSMRLLAAQFAVTKARDILPACTDLYQQKKASFIATREEEIFTDTFAAKYASKDDCIAFDKDILSLDASLKLQKAAQKQSYNDTEQTLIAAEIHPVIIAAINSLSKIDDFLAPKIVKLRDSSTMVHDFIDPEHPSNRARSAIIAEALKDK